MNYKQRSAEASMYKVNHIGEILQVTCLKDLFPLFHIDLMVNSTNGHNRLNFLDAFSGYNQIQMDPRDEEQTTFMTDQGIYCYKVMSFGLKNVGSAY